MRRSRTGGIEERFMQRFVRGSSSDCWEWTGTMHGSGYGVISGRLNGVQVGKLLAHRAAWIIFRGEIPDGGPGSHGWVVMHACDNRKCVNPAHLRLGTQTDNIADMDAKGRAKRIGILPRSGGAHHRAKLSAEQVAAIMFGGKTDDEFAEEFGVHRATVKRARLGESYKQESGGAARTIARLWRNGENNPASKLTYEQVKFARESTLSTYEIAAALGVTQACAAAARRGATYKDVDVPIPAARVGRPRKAA